MSRTYRHGARRKTRVFGLGFYTGRYPADPAPPKKKRTAPDRWHWLWSTPSDWTRQMMTKPQRAAVRTALRKLHSLNDLEDYDQASFPLARKPHQYFW